MLGKFVKEGPKNGGDRPVKTTGTSKEPVSPTPALKDLTFSKKQSSEAQLLHTIKEEPEKFEAIRGAESLDRDSLRSANVVVHSWQSVGWCNSSLENSGPISFNSSSGRSAVRCSFKETPLPIEEDDILNAEHSKTPFESVVQFEAILWPDIALDWRPEAGRR
jgi:hypothetical protein